MGSYIKQRVRDVPKLGVWVILISIMLFISAFYFSTLLQYSHPVLTLVGFVLPVFLVLCGLGLLLSFKIAREATTIGYVLNIIILAIFLIQRFPNGWLTNLISIGVSVLILWYINKPEVIEKFY